MRSLIDDKKDYFDACNTNAKKVSCIMNFIFDENDIPDAERICVLWGTIHGKTIVNLKTLAGTQIDKNPYDLSDALYVHISPFLKHEAKENDDVCITLNVSTLDDPHKLLYTKLIITVASIGCDAQLELIDRINCLLDMPTFGEYRDSMKELLEIHGAKTKLDVLNEKIERATVELGKRKAELNETEAHIKGIAPDGIEALDENIRQKQTTKEELQAECDSLQEEVKRAKFVAKFFACGSAQVTNDLSMISDLGISYDDFEKRIDYTYDDSIVVPFLMALSTNQIITLYGPPGTGKTTLVSKMAKALGARCTIVSVQSSWTDSSDLLGYYSPIDKTYEGTVFVEALIEAYREWIDKGNDSRLHLICLDEMNLARVEYYFATFLSLLQLPEKDRTLRLLPSYIEDDLDEMAEKASKGGNGEPIFDKDDLAPEQEYLLRLRKYHSFVLPPNVHFIGTINNDDTTNELSPKVRDRSMFISLDSVETSADKQLEIEDYYPVSFFDVESPENIGLPDEFMSENNRFIGYAQTMVGWMMERMPEYDPYIDDNLWRTKSKIYNYLIITKILPVLRKKDDFNSNYDEYAEAQNVFEEHATSSEYFDLLGGN